MSYRLNDQYIYDLKLLKNYDDVFNFIVKNFGNIDARLVGISLSGLTSDQNIKLEC